VISVLLAARFLVLLLLVVAGALVFWSALRGAD
jgi:hypothetical protein